MVFHRSLSDSKSPQVFRTLLNILADLNNAVVPRVSSRPLISKSSSSCTNILVTVTSAPITIGITVTFMFHSFFNYLARSRILFHNSVSFSFTMWSSGMAKCTIRPVLFFCWQITKSCHLAEIKCSVYVSKSQRSWCVSFSRGGFWAVLTPLVLMVKFEILTQFPVDHLAHSVVSSLILFLY